MVSDQRTLQNPYDTLNSQLEVLPCSLQKTTLMALLLNYYNAFNGIQRTSYRINTTRLNFHHMIDTLFGGQGDCVRKPFAFDQ